MSVFLDIDPEDWIHSNELAFAVPDGFPVSRGHALVIPKRQVKDWWSATVEEKHAILDLVDVLKRRLDVEHAPDGYNVGFNDGDSAGQTVDHLHVHVIPRFGGDVPDPRGGIRNVIPSLGNYLVPEHPLNRFAPSLITPFGGRLKLELIRCFIREDFDRIDLIVSFVMKSGVELIADHIDRALDRGAHIRLLTTDYLQVTDTSALGFFLNRLGHRDAGRLEAKVFSAFPTSFHPKAYMFASAATGEGVAFVGSSNLSRSGITSGVEWNIETRHLAGLHEEFDTLWSDSRSLALTAEWLAGYEEARKERIALRQIGSPPDGHEVSHEEITIGLGMEEPDAAPTPWSVQSDALAALVATRVDGHKAGLVVMATGLGKTWVAAFDSTRPEFRRVLFVAHREEILTQAKDVYRRLRPGGSLAMFTGNGRDPDGEVVFATIQSLHNHRRHFDPEHFDYIIVDEFHRASAPTYRRVLAHFSPKFVLGLTATPDRSDAADLLALCSDNRVYECGLVEGVKRGLLCPFTYRAIVDAVDYEHIPWRSGKFDLAELTTHLATIERAEQVLREWRECGGAARRTFGFCATIDHADFMAEQFRDAGIAAVAVHSGPSSAPRAECLERLTLGEIALIFTVDLFNEGIDVPAIDLVLMLRPTESPIVFFQQLGRGLRQLDGKERLDVFDLVGNHRGFLLKARLLAELAGRSHITDREALEFLKDARSDLADGSALLPPGCSIVVDPEVIDVLAHLPSAEKRKDRLRELVLQWVRDHDGRRPTALELSLFIGEPFAMKSIGGWVGFLHDIDSEAPDEDTKLLTQEEELVFQIARDFLLFVEHGSYTKSDKLVTLGVLAQSGTLRSGISLLELSATCKWKVMSDILLRADLTNASSAFVDVGNPTQEEWHRYWLKNPVKALTSSNAGSEQWFTVFGETLKPNFEIPEELGATFDSLVAELVAYRLHRHFAQQKAKRVGEERQFSKDGKVLDARFVVESNDGRPTSILMNSAGGTGGTEYSRNADYADAFDLLLGRLGVAAIPILDIYLDTKSVRSLEVPDRRLDPPGLTYPLDLQAVESIPELGKALRRSMATKGRSSEARGGGNQRRRTRFVISVDDYWTSVALADALASGEFPSRPSARRSTGERPGNY